MRIEPEDLAALRPLLVETVRNVLAELAATDAKLGQRLAFDEREAAALLGTKPHVLADARRRGEISGKLIGKRMHYDRRELLRFMAEGGHSRT